MAKHRKARRPVIAGAALVPVSAMAVIAGAGHAGATPTTSQPGVTPPTTSQPGVTSPGTPSQPGVTTKPSTTNEWKYVPGFDPGPYRNVETIPEPGSVPTQAPTPAPAAPAAPAPSYQGDGGGQQAYYYQAPQPEQAAPEVVEDAEADLLTEGGLVKPIQAEDGKVRIGMIKGDRPDWLPEDQADMINNTSAVLEAQGATAFNSLGIPTTRSQRVAAGTLAGATIGAVTGATIVGVPFALAGAAAGGAIGYAIWSAPTLGLPNPAVLGGTAGGAALGAAIAGVPAAAVGGLVGGAIGGVIGGAFGAGENMGEAAEPAPPAPFDKDALTAQTRQVVAQIESVPGGTVVTDGFRGASDAFQAALDNGRNAIAAQPNGEGILAQIDGADQAIKNVLNPTHEAADAIGIGIHVPVPEPTPAPAVA
ncbi:hypothetical protein G4H71_13885 [Rhodococcus triatomae]|uniref:Insoluble domain protein n=1 Tax=Rhodococcus triatomae TaxID=300028 RepID=A0A1G8PIC6_9NOCA|nr:hypothetical protein [Rhodococcus triatomae]QNG20114.1 hypothetical protein G4H72_16490 [Rhodococcus triatomae]QNG23970.1 hypothetical protein G4H71_13885 [Rhodococcus triatomae]SDI92269.1 hypothetical protein SAMN05444695_11342 [Rhodococcus triatomae]